MKKLLLGPYVGDIIQEITTFRPYAKHITELFDVDEVIVSSHYNRRFFYDWVDTFVPVPSELTNTPLNQKGYIHKDITKVEYNRLAREMFNNFNDVDHFSLPYTKTISHLPFQEKSFHPFVYPEVNIPYKNFIIFIPDPMKVAISILDELKDNFDVIVINDKCDGIINYEDIFNLIHNANMVVTSCSHWAFVCNIQGIPLFYWGDDASMYKPDGVYGFNNNKSFSVKPMNGMIRQIKYSYDKLWNSN